MKVLWDKDVTMHGNATCIVRIYSGQTQSAANWRAGLSAQRRAWAWWEAQEWIYRLAEAGKDLAENAPIVERSVFNGKAIACVFGVISNEVTPSGRVFGEYRFVLCLDQEQEVLLVLAKVFRIDQQLQRRK